MKLKDSPLFESSRSDPSRRAGRATPALLAPALALAAVVGSVYAAGAILYGLFSFDALGIPPLVVLAADLGLAFAVILILLFLWLALFERRGLIGLFGETDALVFKAARGAVVGFSLAAGTILVLALLGLVSLDSANDAAAPVGRAALAGVFAAGLVWLFPAVVEELVARGWLLTTVANRYGVIIGMGLSSLAFVLWHVAANVDIGFLAAANLFLAGVFWCIYALREGSLIGVCVAHAVYNWTESNFFGLDYYGEEPGGGSLLNLQQSGSDFLTGGGVGISTTGGFAFTAVILIAIAAALISGRVFTKGER